MKKLAALLGILVLTAAASFAQVFDFTLVNKTGDTIQAVYVSPSIDDEWGEDVLGEDVLEDGDSFEIIFDEDYEEELLEYDIDEYDLRCEYEDGSYDEWTNIVLEEIVQLTISLDKKGNTVAKVK